MRSKNVRHVLAVTAVMVFVVGLASPASAHAWRAPYDTDNISRSTPSQKAWTSSAKLTWQREHVHRPSLQVEDRRASFTARLNVRGAKGSCVQFKMTTYKKWRGSTKVSRYLPSKGGYYKYCSSSGRGSKVVSGSDRLDVGPNTQYREFDRAVVRVCYTRSSSTPVGGDCYTFTARSGD